MMVFGAVMMGTMIFMPRGVVPSLAGLFAARAHEAGAGAAAGRDAPDAVRKRGA